VLIHVRNAVTLVAVRAVVWCTMKQVLGPT
jgi:hypothetical protein